MYAKGGGSNTQYLYENYGFRGLLLDGSFENEKINLYREMVYAKTIRNVFKKYNVPQDFDLLCIDIDGWDLFIAKELLWKKDKNDNMYYRPRVVVTEINSGFPHDSEMTVFDPSLLPDVDSRAPSIIDDFYEVQKARTFLQTDPYQPLSIVFSKRSSV